MTLNWLPNAISLLRIALVGPVVYLVVYGQYQLALLVFFVAGFSDGIDGYLARKFDWRTRFGALIDPLADKLLVACTFVALVYTGLAPLWLGVLVIARDVIIIGGATAYNFLVGPVQGEPTRISKFNTALEILFVLSTLIRAAWSWPQEITILVLGAAVYVTVVISGLDYVWSWSQRARRGSGVQNS
jgi:cardiolipin synthase